MNRLLALFLSLMVAQVNAELFDRGEGFIYDDVLDVTWIQNADIDGSPKTWYEAATWVEQLSLTHSGKVYDDWRLANMDVNGDGTIAKCTTVTEVECRDNELGYMGFQYGVSPTTPGPFTNVGGLYWSSTDYDANGWTCNSGPEGNCAWRQGFGGADSQNYVRKWYSGYGAWAVRDGDVEIPHVSIAADEIYECSAPNSAAIEVAAEVTQDPSDPIVLTEWFLDDEPAAFGTNVEIIAPIGESTLTVEVTTMAGETASDSHLITVVDTAPPAISIDFIDSKGGAVQQINRNGLHALSISLEATDLCDPEVVPTAVGGVPLADGAELLIHATLNEVTIQSNAFQVKAIAEDDSGNSTTATQTLSIVE